MGDRFRRPLGAAAALVCASLLAAGCGTRLPDEAFGEGQFVRASDEQVAAGEVTTDVAVGDDTTATTTAGAPAGGGGSTGAGGPRAAGGGGTGGGGAPGAQKANYASDVGVTATSIRIGTIITISGPMPGQFEPWLLGLRVWVNETNEKGGINGRKIELITCDDQMDSEKNKACARDLIENKKVFAIVGTDTPAMPSAKYVNDQKVPAVGVAPIGNYDDIYPYWFSAYGMRTCPRNGIDDPSDPRYCIRPKKNTSSTYEFFKQKVGVTKAAVFWHNIDISKQAGLDIAKSLEQSGIQVVYTAETQVAEPDYTGHVLQMKDRGVEGVWDAMEINNNIRLMQAMDRQNWRPKAKVSTIAVWGQEIRDQVTGPSRNSLYITGFTKPYTFNADAGIARFNQLFKRFFPNKKRHQWNVDGYGGAIMFGDAVKALGADLTRQRLVDHLNALKDYNPGGLYAPTIDFRPYPDSYYETPQPPPSCLSYVKFEGDDFMAVDGQAVHCVQGKWIESSTL